MSHDHRTRSETQHPLHPADATAVDAMRKQIADLKGTLRGPEGRSTYDEIMSRVPAPEGVTWEEAVVGGVPGVWSRPVNAKKGAALLYLHGGAYVLGSARAYRHFVGHLAVRTGVSAFAPDYRLAPEHPFPAATDDARAVYRALVASGLGSIAIMGDSSGGGLSLIVLATMQAGVQAPVAGVALSPWIDLALTGASMDSSAAAELMLTKEMLAVTAAHYLQGHDATDSLASPLYGPLAGLPPVQLHVGTAEVLLDDSRRYGARARAVGADVAVHVWEGMPHVFPSGVGVFAAAEEALTEISTFLRDRLSTAPLAARLQRYGGADTIEVEAVAMPTPGAGQVVVRVSAAGINGLDWKIREGWMQEALPMQLPATLGLELAGTVVQLGADVTRFAVGDRVMGALRGVGAYARFVAMDAALLCHTPDALRDVDAAALPVATLTAAQLLQTVGPIRSGQKILVHGAAGGVGGFLVQLARAEGATVFATGSASSREYLQRLGVERTFDYRSEHFDEVLRDVDVVIDLVGGEAVDRSWKVLRAGGVLVSTTTPDVVARAPSGVRGLWFMMQPDPELLARLARQVAEGGLRSTLAGVTGFSGLNAALEQNRTGHAPGKLVLDLTR